MKRRGFMLVVALLLMAVILLLSLGFLTSRQLRYSASIRAAAQARARALAEAGMEDARVKIERDLDFTPRGGNDQTDFCYTEQVTSTGGTVMGSYVVIIDTKYAVAPYYTLRIRSQGLAGADPNKPEGTVFLRAEIDVHPIGSPASRDPNQYRITNWIEESP